MTVSILCRLRSFFMTNKTTSTRLTFFWYSFTLLPRSFSFFVVVYQSKQFSTSLHIRITDLGGDRPLQLFPPFSFHLTYLPTNPPTLRTHPSPSTDQHHLDLDPRPSVLDFLYTKLPPTTLQLHCKHRMLIKSFFLIRKSFSFRFGRTLILVLEGRRQACTFVFELGYYHMAFMRMPGLGTLVPAVLLVDPTREASPSRLVDLVPMQLARTPGYVHIPCSKRSYRTPLPAPFHFSVFTEENMG
ncbi:hypothetical protein BDN72DRAFT_680898 [Pluteus cervinus]|uniref:Uncharacterized protein n=1 Tax=Pluteus cervinus TaxID=181527 RepID=A0ACD3AT01_9AGAR|nr:hypothetical protein BDN72DRAFT_680898 [Pluteus cervinus]